MKLSVLQENLNRGLGTVSHAIATRTTLPITTHVLLQTDQSRLRLTATNLEIAISCWIGASVETEGSLALPARLLSELVGALRPERIDLDVTASTREMRVVSGRVDATMSGQDADDFPPIPGVQDGVTVDVPAGDLRTAIARVAFAAATDNARPVLTGVHTSIQGDVITMAAADGFRLAVQTIQLPAAASQNVDAIIPAKSLLEVDRLLADQEDAVTMAINEKKTQVLFRFGNVEIVSQLVQGTFPNYRQLIPENYTTRIVADMPELPRKTRTAAIFARDNNGIIRLHMTPGENETTGTIRLTSRAEEIGDYDGTVDANVVGEATQIAFNSRYLTDVLAVLDKSVALEVSGPSSPGTIRPADGDDTYVHVVMPMFVQW